MRERTASSDPDFSFNNVFGNQLGGYYDDDTTNAYTSASDINNLVNNAAADATNNVDWIPRFQPAPAGTASSINYDPAKHQSVLTDSNTSLVPNALAGLTINPNSNQWLHFYIITNTATTITTWGDMTSVATAPCPYMVFDYHLAGSSQNIDAGTNALVYEHGSLVNVVTNDIDGDSRPTGLAYDIGADEFLDSDSDMLADYWEDRYGLNKNNRDTDGDGMNDGWELAHRNPWLAQNGNVDPDGDGMTDLAESIAGTNPDDATSSFRITSIRHLPNGNIQLNWASQMSKTYRVCAATNLSNSISWSVISGLVPSAGDSTSFTNASTNAVLKFYKVQVLP